jgi:hypothetical protein
LIGFERQYYVHYIVRHLFGRNGRRWRNWDAVPNRCLVQKPEKARLDTAELGVPSDVDRDIC